MPIDREAFERRIEEMNRAISDTLHLGNIEVEDFGFENEEGFLKKLGSSEQLPAGLR